MDLKIQNGNGSHFLRKKRGILATRELMKLSMDSHPTTRVSSHNHGEELKKLIQLTDLRTQISNGLTRNHLLNMISSTLVIRKLMKAYMDSQPRTQICNQLHTQERNMPIMVSSIHHSNICHKSKTLETQSMLDQMCTTS
jgi:hypothetical protein